MNKFNFVQVLTYCLKTAENSPIVAETKDGPYLFTTSGWSKVDSFGDVVLLN